MPLFQGTLLVPECPIQPWVSILIGPTRENVLAWATHQGPGHVLHLPSSQLEEPWEGWPTLICPGLPSVSVRVHSETQGLSWGRCCLPWPYFCPQTQNPPIYIEYLCASPEISSPGLTSTSSSLSSLFRDLSTGWEDQTLPKLLFIPGVLSLLLWEWTSLFCGVTITQRRWKLLLHLLKWKVKEGRGGRDCRNVKERHVSEYVTISLSTHCLHCWKRPQSLPTPIPHPVWPFLYV